MAISAPVPGKSLPMSVHNVGFLLDRLGQDCSPLQFLRELTQNAIEAINRTGQPGQIVWDVDWTSFDLAGGPMKLCITDTGDGMTGEDMLRFINQLSSSGSQQSLSTNYGVGAKIAAATKNPAGVVFQSWRDGHGWMVHLEKNSGTGEYGLRQWELGNGNYGHYFPLDESVKPNIIEANGTKVILVGAAPDSDTMRPPDEAAAPSRWVSKYLNTRYFRFPDNVTVKAREGWDFPRNDSDRNVLRSITGQKSYLDQHSVESGKHSLPTATVHWWILKDEPALTNNSGFIESAGHMAALYQNELYDRATQRAGTALLQQFGVLFGARYVVMYVEPKSDRLTTNTARTTLLINGEKLPWDDWAFDFRENMPKKLAEFVQEKALASTDKDHVKSIKDRLKGVMDLYRVSRYKPAPQGVYLSDSSSSVDLATSDGSSARGKGRGGSGVGIKTIGSDSRGKREVEIGTVYHLFEKKDGGVASERAETDPFPVVKWVTVKNDSRPEGDMEDKAAKYLSSQNTLLINADFRVYEDMISRLAKAKDVAQGIDIRDVVTEVVRQWFEQALIETVIGIQQLKGSKEWGHGEIERALSEEALTAAVMQRYHVFNACKRELGAKLGKGMREA